MKITYVAETDADRQFLRGIEYYGYCFDDQIRAAIEREIQLLKSDCAMRRWRLLNPKSKQEAVHDHRSFPYRP